MALFSSSKTSFGNLITGSVKQIGSTLNKNLGDGISTLGKGLNGIGRSVLDEAFGLNLSNSAGVNSSPYPLGDEWSVDPAYMVTIAFTDPNTGMQSTVQGYMPDTISMGLSADYVSPLESIGEMASGAGGPVSAIAKMFGYRVSANIFSMVLWSGSSHMDLTLELRFVALTDTYKDVIEPIRKLTSLITPTIEPFSASSGPIQLGMMKSPGPSLTFEGDTSVMNQSVTILQDVGNSAGALAGGSADTAKSVLSGEQTAVQGIVNAGGMSVEAIGGMVNTILRDIKVKNNISVKLGEFALLKSVVVKDVTPAYNVKSDLDGNWTDATVSVQIGTFVSPTNLDIPHMVGFRAGAEGTASGTSLGGLTDAASNVFQKVGINQVPTLTDMMGSIGATVTTASTKVRDAIFKNPSSLGKDAGMGAKLMDTVFDKKTAPSAPGMSEIDKLEYKAQMYSV